MLNKYKITKEKKVIETVVLEGKKQKKPNKLKVDVKAGICDFQYSFAGEKWITMLVNTDATNLSTQKAGGFIGTCIGFYATSTNLINRLLMK